MNKIKFLISMLVITLALGTVLTGCPTDVDPDPAPGPTRYTVWIGRTTFSDFIDDLEQNTQDYLTANFTDGKYIRSDINNTQWDDPGSDGRYNWTEGEIKTWFLGMGFDDITATKETKYLIGHNHVMYSIRAGDIVHILLK